MLDIINFTVSVMQSDDAAIATITSECGHVLAQGTSKRHPNDPFNEDLGFNLAVARAFRQYADFMDIISGS